MKIRTTLTGGAGCGGQASYYVYLNDYIFAEGVKTQNLIAQFHLSQSLYNQLFNISICLEHEE